MAREENKLFLDRVGVVVIDLQPHGISYSPLDTGSITSSCFGLITNSKIETKINFADIYAIEQIEPGSVYNPSKTGISSYIEIHRFVVHAIIRPKSESSPWILAKYIFGHRDLRTCQLWIEILNAQLINQYGRPKNLLVLVHPLCGKRKGIKTWETVAPLFSRAKVETKVIVTKRAGHAYDLISKLSDRELRSLDGIITVGGDGLFNEVLNALLPSRHEAPFPSPPIGDGYRNQERNINENDDDTCHVGSSADDSYVSPGTSSRNDDSDQPLLTNSQTNGISLSKLRTKERSDGSVSFPNDWFRLGLIPAGSTDAIVLSSTGVRDPVTSAMHIILGSKISLDVARVVRWKTSPSSVMPSPTIHYAASFVGYGFYGDVIKESEKYRWMGPKRYDFAGTLVFLQHKSYEVEVTYMETKNTESSRNKQICRTNCLVCKTRSESDNDSSDRDTTNSDIKWKRIKGECISVGGAVISCRNEKAPDGLVSDAHLSDGLLDLIFIKDCPRPHYLWHLTQLTKKGSEPLKYSFVEHHKTPAFTFVSKHDESLWNLDGEMFRACQVSVQVCHGVINLFASGPQV